MFARVLLLAFGILGARGACQSTCSAIAAHDIEMINGTHDFAIVTGSAVCTGTNIDLSSSDSSTFGFPIADNLWSVSHTFANSAIRFLAHSNQSGDATIKISLEEQGSTHACESAFNYSVDNETFVTWEAPAFVAGEHYTTPDLSSLLNALSFCPVFAVFRLESFYGNGTAEGAREVVSFETLANATRLTLNAQCPSTPAATEAAAATDSEDNSEKLNSWAIAGIIILSVLSVAVMVLVPIYLMR